MTDNQIDLTHITTGTNNIAIGWREVSEVEFWRHIDRSSPAHTLKAAGDGLLYYRSGEANQLPIGRSTTTPDHAFYIPNNTPREP